MNATPDHNDTAIAAEVNQALMVSISADFGPFQTQPLGYGRVAIHAFLKALAKRGFKIVKEE